MQQKEKLTEVVYLRLSWRRRQQVEAVARRTNLHPAEVMRGLIERYLDACA